MALSEKLQHTDQSPAPNTLNRGRESVAPKRSTVIEILKSQRFMGVPKIIAAPILGIMTIASACYAIHEVYQQVPPVHKAIDKAWDTSLEAFGLRTNQDNPNINNTSSSANTGTK